MYSSFLNIKRMKVSKENTNSMSLSDCDQLQMQWIFYHHNMLNFNEPLQEGADKSLARPTSRCHRTQSIVLLERGACSCAKLQVFSCYRGWKEACQVTIFRKYLLCFWHRMTWDPPIIHCDLIHIGMGSTGYGMLQKNAIKMRANASLL